MSRTWRTTVGAVAVGMLTVGVAACGGDGGDEAAPKAAEATTTDAPPATPDLNRFLFRDGDQPGFRVGAAPGAMPEEQGSIAGVDALAADQPLTTKDVKRLNGEGFVAMTYQPIRGPRTAGVLSVSLFKTSKGARHNLAYELSPAVMRKFMPKAKRFGIAGVPGARGFAAVKPGYEASDPEGGVGQVFWAQGRCVFILGNQGPGPFSTSMAKGARAIYERTNGACP